MPLVVIPILIVGIVVGYVSTQQAHLGITRITQADLEHTTQFTLDLLAVYYQQSLESREAMATAQEQARQALKGVNIGETGYLYVINPRGDLLVHAAREGDNIYDAQDETGSKPR